MRLGMLVNAAAGIFVAGFIWTMQLIHYPLFDYVGEEAFPAYKITHNRLFLLMADPGILVTLATSVLLISCGLSRFLSGRSY
jgi:TM2 domain-containing membrane protein YozV